MEKTEKLNKKQALQAMEQGHLIRHKYYDLGEFIFMKGGVIWDESGYSKGTKEDKFWKFYQNFQSEWEIYQLTEVDDKINDLLEKFSSHVYPYMGSGFLTNTPDDEVILLNSRTYALILAKEMLLNLNEYNNGNHLNMKHFFWELVIKQLEKFL